MNSAKAVLIAIHDRLLGVKTDTAVDGVGDLVDHSAAHINLQSIMQASSITASTLSSVNEAIARCDDGTYGVCGICGVQIPKQRMQAIPWALHCVGCQEQVEGDSRKFLNVDSDFDDAELSQDE